VILLFHNDSPLLSLHGYSTRRSVFGLQGGSFFSFALLQFLFSNFPYVFLCVF